MSILDQVPEYIRRIVPYVPGKPIDEVEREYGIEGSAKLASNENPLGPSPKAVAALRERLEELHLYPDGGCFHLRQALAAKLRVAPERLVFGNGSNELIELAVRTFLRPGDEALLSEGTFVAYPLSLNAMGAVMRTVPLKDYGYDLAAMAGALTAKTRCVFLANPNNPTGTIYRRPEWEAFLERVGPDVLVVADEAYFEYATDPDYPDSLDDQRDDRAVLTLRTFSKVYGLAGLRVGYGIAHPDIVAMMNQVREPFNVNAAAQWAATAAVHDTEHLRRSVEVNNQGLAFLGERLTALGVQWVPSQANFILVRVGPVAGVFEAMLRRGVIVRPVGPEFPEHVRVTVGTPDENRRFLDCLERILEGGAAG
ncbi:MAG: histidinol-phosphate transaminase [Deltaproteobacteria bacterium]|nr:histidinol-phosphate transaminase [Deltaproteobacteria bacterium]MDE0214145.1 histidinol-phosphate transaminase [Deltaproteobacteria bacterium]